MNPRARILIVDDERGARSISQAVLTKEGYEVTPAESGEEALELLQNDAGFDLVLLDMMMMGIDGLEVLKTMKSNPATARIRVIIASGLSEPEDMVQAFLAGASDYIIKPPHPLELIARVETQLRLKQSGQESQ